MLLLEKDPAARKKLCDMLSRERIIGVATKQQVLEALVRHQKKLNALVANASLLHDLLSEETIVKLCNKISIKVPPIVVLYKTDQEHIINEIDQHKYQCEFVQYDVKDVNFPVAYAKAVKKVHPDIIIDMNKANEVWLKSEETQDLLDIRKWLGEAGFAETPKKAAAQKKVKADDVDYKKLYLELKKEYDKLLAELDELKKLFS